MKIILTGASGMIGEGVMIECLQNDLVKEVLMVNRKHIDVQHPKLKELILPNFKDAASHADTLRGYDACFYCAGKSVLGMTEADYHDLTYDTTMAFAVTLKNLNPLMVFNFVSGGHTDSTEKGKAMWARIKGKTENALMRLFGSREFNFRPILMKPTKGQKNFTGYNRWLFITYPIFKYFFPACTIQQIGQAMIHAVLHGYPKQTLEVTDIKKLSTIA